MSSTFSVHQNPVQIRHSLLRVGTTLASSHSMMLLMTIPPSSIRHPHQFSEVEADEAFEDKPDALATFKQHSDDSKIRTGHAVPTFASGLGGVGNSPAYVFADLVEQMTVEPWSHAGPLTPRAAGRVSSVSPGFADPESPAFYPDPMSHPLVAVTDAPDDGFHGLAENDDLSYQMAKSFTAAHDTAFYANYPKYTFTPAVKPRMGHIRSRPLSGASSVNSDSPRTPVCEPDDAKAQYSGEPRDCCPAPLERSNSAFYSPSRSQAAHRSAPKLDRTMTDVYGDELYSPSFIVGSTSPAHAPVSPNNELFAQRLQAANSQHLNAGHSPNSVASRDRSPFRNGSALAPMPIVDLSTSASSAQTCYGSAQQICEGNKVVQDARAVQQQMDRNSEVSTPQTISPRDALLDYHDAEAVASVPLFPGADAASLESDAMVESVTQVSRQFDAASLDDGSFGDFIAQLPTTLQIPQQYPFMAGPHVNDTTPTPPSTHSFATSRLGSSESGHPSPQRPENTSADGGTYTCTYHGCTMRFETPSMLQKHKREGHRLAHGIGGRRPDAEASGMTTSLLNSQAGPHRCDRINPSTGKSCNTIFSRPYDLTRHEDTIHNARKQKVRCDLCTDEKSFSRADALTRHYRVCHPEVEFQGKHRRRVVQGP